MPANMDRTRTVVAVDVDHTLAKFLDGLVQWHNAEHGSKVPLCNARSPYDIWWTYADFLALSISMSLYLSLCLRVP